MRAVIQRVSQASVAVAGADVASIGRGLLVLVAVGRDDTDEDAAYVVDKMVNLRIFGVLVIANNFRHSHLLIGSKLRMVPPRVYLRARPKRSIGP